MSRGSHADFMVIKAPHRVKVSTPSVILYGSIEQNVTVGWRSELASSLSDLPVAILNPLREDWDNSWKEDISDPNFKEQVQWEMDHGQIADVIAFYFDAATLAPITLMEFGLHATTGKVVVWCHPEFKKRGNVQIVCLRNNIPLVSTKEDLKKNVRGRLIEKLKSAG